MKEEKIFKVLEFYSLRKYKIFGVIIVNCEKDKVQPSIYLSSTAIHWGLSEEDFRKHFPKLSSYFLFDRLLNNKRKLTYSELSILSNRKMRTWEFPSEVRWYGGFVSLDNSTNCYRRRLSTHLKGLERLELLINGISKKELEIETEEFNEERKI